MTWKKAGQLLSAPMEGKKPKLHVPLDWGKERTVGGIPAIYPSDSLHLRATGDNACRVWVNPRLRTFHKNIQKSRPYEWTGKKRDLSC